MNNLKTGLIDIDQTIQDKIVTSFKRLGDLDSKDSFFTR